MKSKTRTVVLGNPKQHEAVAISTKPSELSGYEQGRAEGERRGRDWAVKLISNLSYLRGVVESPLSLEKLRSLEGGFFHEVRFLPGLHDAVAAGEDREWNLGLVEGFTQGLCGQVRLWDSTVVTIST